MSQIEDVNNPLEVTSMEGVDNVSVKQPLHVSYPWVEVDSEEHQNIAPLQRERKRWIRPTTGESSNLLISTANTTLYESDCEEEYSVHRNAARHDISKLKPLDSVRKDKEPYGLNKPLRDDVSSYSASTAIAKSSDIQNKTSSNNNHSSFIQHLIAGSLLLEEGMAEKQRLGNEPIQEYISNTDMCAGVRIPSPSSVSSVTSGRRLEWDSGADVGYLNYQQIDQDVQPGSGLSTLARGCSAALCMRLDPEGTSSSAHTVLVNQCAQQNKYNPRRPLAESTPVDCFSGQREIVRNVAGNIESEHEITPILREKIVGKHLSHCLSSDEYENEVEQRVLLRYRNQKKDFNDSEEFVSSEKSFNVLVKKYSSSLSDLSVCDNQMENPGRSLPRSCSSLSLSDKEKKKRQDKSDLLTRNILLAGNQPHTLTAACSASSSSVATIVQKQDFPHTSDKIIQTSHMLTKFSVGIQTNENLNYLLHKVNNEYPMNVSGIHYKHGSSSNEQIQAVQFSHSNEEKIHTSSSQSKCTGAHKKGLCCIQNKDEFQNVLKDAEDRTGKNSGSSCSVHTVSQGNNSNKDLSHNLIQQEHFGTLESNASSTQTAGSSLAAETSQSGAGVQTEGVHRGSAGVVGSANSFEYLPGHVYESNVAAALSNPEIQNTVTEDSCSEASVNPIHSKTGKSSRNNEVSDEQWGSSSSSSLTRDLEQGVQMIKNLVAGKAYNSKLKKALIRRVIDKLVESDYVEDSLLPKPSLPLDSNVPWIPVQPSTSIDTKHLEAFELQEKNREPSIDPACEERFNQKSSSLQDGTSIKMATDKCVGTAISDETTLSSCTPSGSVSLPGGHDDSRAETTTEVSSNVIQSPVHESWKHVSTQSEKEFEYQKQHQKCSQLSSTKGLVDFCHSERQNQLYWIGFEIEHLNNLKQLLEKQEGVNKSLASLAFHEHKYHKTTVYSSISESTEKSHEKSKRSTSTTNSNSNQSNEEHNEQLSKHGSSSRKNNKSGTPNWSTHHYLVAKKEICTQLPSHSELDQSTSPVDRKSTETQKYTTQTPSFDSSGSIPHNADSVAGSILDGSAKNGRINVYGHIIQQKALLHQNKSRGNYDIKRGRVEKVLSGKENSEKLSDKQLPICCCECKRMLKEIVEKNKSGSKESSKLSPVSADASICENCRISNVTNKDGEEVESTARLGSTAVPSHTTSRTSEDVVDISSESKEVLYDKMRSVATETTENIAVQTTPSLNELPIIRPLWYSRNKPPKEVDNKQTIGTCCACGLLQSESSSTMSKMSKDSTKYCHCHIHRLRVDKACPCCKVLESHVTSKTTKLSSPQNNPNKKHTIKEKCCPCCGRSEYYSKSEESNEIKVCKVRQSKQSSLESSKHETESESVQSAKRKVPNVTKQPLAYVLTFEAMSDTNHSGSNEKTKTLPEIKIKLPAKKQSSKDEENKSKSSSSSKENQKPETEEVLNTNFKQMPKATLQEYLRAHRPDYVGCADKRRQCIADLAYLREMRHERRQALLAMSNQSEFMPKSTPHVMRPASNAKTSSTGKTVFTTRGMHIQTKKIYQRAAEVKSKRAELKKKEDYRTNRLMAEIFAKKLQKKTLQGKLNISNSESVISIF